MAELDDLRGRIDAVDRGLVDLLVERLHLAMSIGRAKERSGLSFYDPERERIVLDRILEQAAGRYPASKLRAVYREIISVARTEQAAETILVHGTRGSLSHQAAWMRFGGSATFQMATREDDLFARLDEGTCAYAVVSLEGQSLEASLDRFDPFLHTSAQIFGAITVRPRLGLYGPTSESDGARIFAPPSILVQASRWIADRQPRPIVQVTPTLDEALVRARADGGTVLAHPIVEWLEGWVALEQGLEDFPESKRRFFILSRRESPATGRDRTSLLAVLANRTGALHEVTSILARHRINLAWIEPKSTQLGSWDHLFLLEVDGHREEPALLAALGELRAISLALRVLGSYPAEDA
ncbi:MAG: chorismate mutase [Candidatus Eisenbacteria bacterium]|uniref:Bifunctional chorismate mutase/prephenate dehydratase n=1 Tax=Eiseniibacteriota bacterium TaxID=2212470 RepID=A0A956LZK8_UNCEI|nr:chorismate mutase [Candidatus Eisenbacteria bacterium]